MDTYYDTVNDRLIQIETCADSKFWEDHWKESQTQAALNSAGNNKFKFVVSVTGKYLKNGLILEAGCGAGDKVLALKLAGYEVIGLDFAKETVENLNNLMPQLDIRLGDVKKPPFPDEYFDGYWSLGVIEHFYEGYDSVIKQMHRVLKKGGFAFVTFPCISPLRKSKMRLNLYPLWHKGTGEIKDFYQFVLDYKKVVKDFQNNGFTVIKIDFLDGIKCVKDEIEIFKPVLQKIYDSKNIYIKMIKFVINKFISRLAGHLALIVVKKTS